MKTKKTLKILCLFFCSVYLFSECEKEITPVNINSLNTEIKPTVKTILYDKVGADFNDLKETFKLKAYLKSKKEVSEFAKTTKDSLGFTIYTDEIKEITLGNYVSYTMRIKKPTNYNAKTTSNFYNLTIESNNGIPNMFITKYTPSYNWLQNTKVPFEGTITSMRADAIDYEGGNYENETGGTDGPGGGSSMNTFGSSQGSTEYPIGCNGQVIITTETTEYPCTCPDAHSPREFCTCDKLGGHLPEVIVTTTYYCDPFYDAINNGNNNDNSSNRGGSTGGGLGDNPDPDDTSISMLLGPDEECGLSKVDKKYDLNADCKLDSFEACMSILKNTSFHKLNETDTENIIEFIKTNGCGQTQQQFINLAIEALINKYEVNFEDKIINGLTGKAKCVYDKLVKTGINNHNLIRETFIEFGEGNFGNTTLIYKQESGLVNANGVPLNGQTSSQSSSSYIINLNSDRINNRASVEIAKTIVHESLHALLKKHFSTGTESFIALFGEYMKKNTGSNDITHAIMRDHYVASISNTLKQFDNNQETQQFYDDLAWEGLHQFLPKADIDRIIQTINTARNRGINCN